MWIGHELAEQINTERLMKLEDAARTADVSAIGIPSRNSHGLIYDVIFQPKLISLNGSYFLIGIKMDEIHLRSKAGNGRAHSLFEKIYVEEEPKDYFAKVSPNEMVVVCRYDLSGVPELEEKLDEMPAEPILLFYHDTDGAIRDYCI